MRLFQLGGRATAFGLILTFGFLLATGCQKKELDKHGGYVDEKTGQYRYVKPSRKPISESELKPKHPRPWESQNIWGKVTRVDSNLRDVWIHIRDRQSYQILADSLAKGNRNDQAQELKVTLEYVNPLASFSGSPTTKQQWQRAVHQNLKEMLVGRRMDVEIRYYAKAQRFTGVATIVVETKEGRKLRDLNQWLILEGYSYLFYDERDKNPPQDYFKAQTIAKNKRAGVWQYE